MNLDELVSYLDGLLGKTDWTDYPNAFNGLQVENSGSVSRVAVAVDACEKVIEQAVNGGANLLVVHHGMFWGGSAPVTGVMHRKLSKAIHADLAIYSAHLPLDAHPVYGNNALLCDALKLSSDRRPFLKTKDRFLGFQVDEALSRDELRKRLETAVGGGVHLAPGGPDICRRIGVVTGGAGGEIFKAAAEGVDTFITGEGPHWSFTAAEEIGVNLFYAGHYATETFGVKALGAHLEKEFGLPSTFIDHPTGL